MSMTFVWFVGYLIYVWLTPAKFNMTTFVVPLVVLAVVETTEYIIKKLTKNILEKVKLKTGKDIDYDEDW